MKLITREYLASIALDRWNEQDPQGKGGVESKLEALGGNPSPESVDLVIGNDSWTSTPPCDECCLSDREVIQLGCEDDDLHICRECITLAGSL